MFSIGGAYMESTGHVSERVERHSIQLVLIEGVLRGWKNMDIPAQDGLRSMQSYEYYHESENSSLLLESFSWILRTRSE